MQTPEYQAAWRAANPDKVESYSRKYYLREKYGMTLEDYVELWNKQDGKCWACGQVERIKDRTGRVRKWLSVDHDHRTGKIRGLLCHHCNAVLGHANDDIELLKRLTEYLEEHS